MQLWGLSSATLARELVANGAMAVPAIRRRRLQGMRTRSGSTEFEALKILAQFEFLRGSAGCIQDRVVAEIGPGDAIGLAPLFITAGACRYIAIDRFLGDIWGDAAARLYECIEHLHGPFAGNWRERIEVVRHSIEQPARATAPADVLLSFDVIEHLRDVPRAVRNMRRMLKADGRMIHRVDYGPHGAWLATEDPLAFLSVPQWLWSAMGSHRGHPNRVRHEELVRLLRSEGLQVTERATRARGPDVLDAELACAFQAAPGLGSAYREPACTESRAA